VRTEQLKEDKLEIHDWYTLTLGQKREQRQSDASPSTARGDITRGPPAESLKVADLSIYFARQLMPLSQEPEFLLIEDNLSVLDRFNDEKSWVELYLTRRIPASSKRRITCLRGLVKGVHSDWAYRTLEAAVDGIIDFKVDEVNGARRSFIGIRNMRNVAFDSRWHPLRIGQNFEIMLEK